MKIAFCVEGGADRAILKGLRDRWCPQAELVEGRFRGQPPRSQISKECKVLSAKGADLIIFLRDANLENWREVLRADGAKCPRSSATSLSSASATATRSAGWQRTLTVCRPGYAALAMSCSLKIRLHS